MERRTFLGSAAALAALPGHVEASDGAEVERYVEATSEAADGLYRDADCGSVPGSLTNIEIAADMVDAPVSVSAWTDEDIAGVSLEWGAPHVSVGTTLEPADARELADRLRAAAAFADGQLDAADYGGGDDGAE